MTSLEQFLKNAEMHVKEGYEETVDIDLLLALKMLRKAVDAFRELRKDDDCLCEACVLSNEALSDLEQMAKEGK